LGHGVQTGARAACEDDAFSICHGLHFRPPRLTWAGHAGQVQHAMAWSRHTPRRIRLLDSGAAPDEFRHGEDAPNNPQLG
jgi:hypothetical protein